MGDAPAPETIHGALDRSAEEISIERDSDMARLLEPVNDSSSGLESFEERGAILPISSGRDIHG